MIKYIAFDLVGVLVNEKDISLTPEEEKLEKMFGPNINDSDYLIEARKIFSKDSIIIRTTENLIDKIYEPREIDIFKKIKDKYNNIKIIIATNHVSFIRNFIGETFGVDYLDDILISAEIHKVKPDSEFYRFVLQKYKIKPGELLFIDDNVNNINSAKNLGIETIKVDENSNIFDEIKKIIDKNKME